MFADEGRSIILAGLLMAVAAGAHGCASTPKPTGFISDYSRLAKAGEGKLRFLSPELADYESFIIDPVQIRIKRDPPVLDPEECAEVANYFTDAVGRVLREHGRIVATEAGPRTARVRLAITDIQKSKWFLNLHPAMKLSGAFTGRASLEGEVIDSVTGAQLAATIQAGRGDQFELDTFDELDDVRDVIDRWAKEAGERLDELKQRTIE